MSNERSEPLKIKGSVGRMIDENSCTIDGTHGWIIGCITNLTLPAGTHISIEHWTGGKGPFHVYGTLEEPADVGNLPRQSLFVTATEGKATIRPVNVPHGLKPTQRELHLNLDHIDAT